MWSFLAPSVAALLALAAADSTAVRSDLFYATPTHCTELSSLPTRRDLSGELVQTTDRFQGTVTLTTSTASSGSGCVLHFLVDGEIEHSDSLNHDDVFMVTREIDQGLPKLFASKVLRTSSLDLNHLTLQRIQVKINQNRDYAVDMRVSTLDDAAAAEVTLNGSNCGKVVGKDLVDDVFPGINDVSVVADATKDVGCAMGLNIAGRAPVLYSTEDILGLLKSVDDTLNTWFSQDATKQSASTLANARVAFSAPDSAIGAVAARAPNAAPLNLSVHDRLNAPTKQITLGILMGITVLCAMLFAVVYQKKRHEYSQQARHNNASRVAQIHRVSYRMGYQRVHANDPLRATEEEEKEDLL